MYKITYPREKWDESKINKLDILTLIKKHIAYMAPDYLKKEKYYAGEHEILDRTKKDGPNTKVVCNHAKDISDTATSYFLANALTYSTKDSKLDISRLTDSFDTANVDEVDHDNGLNMSVFGLSYEYVYIKENETTPVSKVLKPTNVFIVYDDTIEEKELCGIYYYLVKDDSDTSKITYKVTLITDNYIYNFEIFDGKDNLPITEEDRQDHHFKEFPLVMYQNNQDCIGDFEQQISLIDAYNILMSDRVNDKAQFLDALLVIYGALLGDDEKETSEAMKKLKIEKLLEMPEGAKAEFLTRTFDETGVEILRKAIKEDIYSFSHVPNLTDENFVGNSSGVAMEYKLLGLEMITKTKSRYYIKGLKKRFRLYCNFLGLKNISINPAAISVNFTRGLPKNLLEISQIIANLKDFVSHETLLNQIPFVEDPQGEIKEVEKAKKQAIDNQRELFTQHSNTPIDEDDLDE